MNLTREILTYLTIALAFHCLGVAHAAESKMIRVAVVDTGMPIKTEAKLCEKGHKDFSGTGMADNHHHSSHVMDVIDQYATNSVRTVKGDRAVKSKVNYCIVVIKFWDKELQKRDLLSETDDTSEALLKALEYVSTLGVNIVNISGGGSGFVQKEYTLIKKMLDAKITIVVAAGNEGKLQRMFGKDYEGYYPALYDDRIVVAGSMNVKNEPEPYSNTGDHIDVWERGTSVIGLNAKGKPVFMSGTSQSSAIRTGKIIRMMSRVVK